MSQELFIGAILALILNECVDVCPWLAGKLVTRAAHRIPDAKRSARLAEEWLALVSARPGKLLKLATAISIALFGAWRVRQECLRACRSHTRMGRWRIVFQELPTPLNIATAGAVVVGVANIVFLVVTLALGLERPRGNSALGIGILVSIIASAIALNVGALYLRRRLHQLRSATDMAQLALSAALIRKQGQLYNRESQASAERA